MKVRALVQTLAMGGVGAGLYLWVSPVGATVVWSLALFLLGLSLVAPSVYDTSEELVSWLASRLTTGIGLVVLVAFYFLVFWSGASWMRLRGRDPMRRAFPDPGPTNWKTRVGYGTDPEIYTRQFTRPHGEVPDA